MATHRSASWNRQISFSEYEPELRSRAIGSCKRCFFPVLAGGMDDDFSHREIFAGGATLPVSSEMNLPMCGKKLLPAVLLMAILGGGSLLVWQSALRADREMRAELLAQTRRIAQTVEVERVQTLTGSAADLSNPEYLRLKAQFAATQAATPLCRFIYLMSRQPAASGGAVVFLVDNEPPESKDISPPGQVFSEAPAAIARVFDSHTAEVAGPSQDRWGTWISGF